MNREEGYYWVNVNIQDGWMIAYWYGEYWQIEPFSENKWGDDFFDEIDERRITRQPETPLLTRRELTQDEINKLLDNQKHDNS